LILFGKRERIDGRAGGDKNNGFRSFGASG
jgi:hypothetical protein